MGLFSNYDIEDILAEGSLATVYRCVRSSDKRLVAVKVLSQQLINRHPEIVKYFKQDSLVLARLRHPHIVRVIEYGLTGGLPYFAMEYIDGRPFDTALKLRTMGLNNKLDFALQISKALAYAHKNGVIHCDLNPANVLVNKIGRIHVTDFCIAHMADTRPGGPPPLLGVPDYLSPEQISGQGVLTAATDIYALGVILYEMFTGRLPGEPLALPSLHDPAIPSYLDEIVTTCLNPDPNKRYASAELVRDKLLQSMWGAHIADSSKQQVLQNIGDINVRLAILDITRETKFSSVYLCQNTVNHNNLVLKKVHGTMDGYKESTMLSNMQHPNVANIYGTSKLENDYIVLEEYLPGGNLYDRLVNPWPWQKAVKTIKNICQGMAFIHANDLVHGNLRPSNILFSKQGEAKVADCGLNEHYRGEAINSNWYAYPNQPKDKLADVFSAGAVLLEMTSNIVPSWKRGELVVNETFQSLPLELRKILKRMLAAVPKDRYRNFEEIIKELDGLPGTDPQALSNEQKTLFSVRPMLMLLLALSALAFFFLNRSSDILGSLMNAFGLR